MNENKTQASPFRVRKAAPADIPALMRLKRLLAEGENSLHAVRASASDWLRDGFGPNAGFTAFVAEDFSGGFFHGTFEAKYRPYAKANTEPNCSFEKL